MVRRLIRDAAPESAKAESGPQPAGLRAMVRLTAAEAERVDIEAAVMGMRRATWIAALVRRQVLGKLTFARADALALMAIRGELRRIGVNVNQIARAMNTAVLEGRVLDAELAGLEDLRRELRAHFVALGEAFEGNLDYWAAP